MEKIQCHDCQKDLEIKDSEIMGGVGLKYDDGVEKIEAYKCNSCFEKNPSLANFRNCEVYSRVVGYIRPVQQWNEGKKQEYQERTPYKAV
jgi:anaerobic ribonucleoside-triphosphate reductase